MSRNKIYAEGLRANGYTVLTCTDRSRGLKKYWQLYKKHKEYKGKYDILVVGYGGHVVVPFAKLISDKPVVFDALCSFYETEILSRDALKEIPFRRAYVRFIDWMTTRFADKILVESEAQKEYFYTKLGVRREKLITVYTGVDDTVFKIDDRVSKFEKFTVLFRGRIMSEAGVPTIIRAAKLLEGEHINFLIVGHGCNEAMQEFESTLKIVAPKNLTYIGTKLSFEELVSYMQKSHVSLGQFAKHERLERTIPHKAYESLALGLPYITARVGGVSEIFEEGKHCLMVHPEDPEDLAKNIRALYNNADLREMLSHEGYALYKMRFTPTSVTEPLRKLFDDIKK
jgi:glycosyltransferase involved in cell wall biosynthesis